jgi:hypothetical protein
MPTDKWEQYAVQPQNNGGADKWAQYATTAPSAPAVAPPSMLQSMMNNFNANTQGAQPGDSGLKGFVENIGQGGGQAIRGLANMIQHPLDSAHSEVDAVRAGPSSWLNQAHQEVNAARADPSRAVGNAIGQLGTGEILGGAGVSALKPIVGGAGKIATAARTAAIGDPDIAALKGLQVGPKSPKSLSTLKAVEGARPYLQGASSLEDLQARIPQAKSEIWQPYQDAVDAIGNRQVKGPDGMTTVSELENQRLQLSALNRGLKRGSPEALQLAAQKGMSQAELLAQEKAVTGALDPELSSTGIDPKGIRKTFGQVSQVGDRVSGKSTLAEGEQPTGLGKIANLSLEHPLQAPGQVLGGLRDLVAGRPMFGAKPTDLGIREGFRTAGPKPDFGTPTPPNLNAAKPLALPAPEYEIPLGRPKPDSLSLRSRGGTFPNAVADEDPLEPRSGDPMAPISDYPGINPMYVGGRAPLRDFQISPTKMGVLKTRDPEIIKANAKALKEKK